MRYTPAILTLLLAAPATQAATRTPQPTCVRTHAHHLVSYHLVQSAPSTIGPHASSTPPITPHTAHFTAISYLLHTFLGLSSRP